LELGVLQRALDKAEVKLHDESGMNQDTVGLLLKRVPWPEGKAAVDAVAAKPAWLALLLGQLSAGAAPVRDYLLEPERFVRLLEAVPASETGLQNIVQALLGSEYPRQSSLFKFDPQRGALILDKMRHSEKPLLRAVTALGFASLDDAEARRAGVLRQQRVPLAVLLCHFLRTFQSLSPFHLRIRILVRRLFRCAFR